jgi:adenylate cyclase
MAQSTEYDEEVELLWRTYLTTGEIEQERRKRRLFKVLPGAPRCKNCYAPFRGAGGRFVRAIYGKRPSNLNPQLCNVCEEFARQHQGGAEIELTLLFADVRGSTTIAEAMSPTEFSRLIDRFYKVASQVMVQSDALIDKIIGDQAAGMYVPGIAGPEHALQAVEAAKEMLRRTGHGPANEPWIPLGIGVHTGTAFVGAVGSDQGTVDITVLGDAANTAARLSSKAGQGDILISEAAYNAAGLQLKQPERRSLALKGKSDAVSVYVLKGE